MNLIGLTCDGNAHFVESVANTTVTSWVSNWWRYGRVVRWTTRLTNWLPRRAENQARVSKTDVAVTSGSLPDQSNSRKGNCRYWKKTNRKNYSADWFRLTSIKALQIAELYLVLHPNRRLTGFWAARFDYQPFCSEYNVLCQKWYLNMNETCSLHLFPVMRHAEDLNCNYLTLDYSESGRDSNSSSSQTTFRKGMSSIQAFNKESIEG